MPYIEYDLSEFTDDELVDEIVDRGLQYVVIDKFPEVDNVMIDRLTSIYQLRRLGKDYDHLVEDIIYDCLGKVL